MEMRGVMNVLDTLTAARNLIADISRWTQGERTIDKLGQICGPSDERAYAWCATGALHKVLEADLSDPNPAYLKAIPAKEALNVAARKLFQNDGTAFICPYIDVNDGRAGVLALTSDRTAAAHANILKVFDEAIATTSESRLKLPPPEGAQAETKRPPEGGLSKVSPSTVAIGRRLA
jgi:hypothetical protein